MGQPERVSPANVLPFPGARTEIEDRSGRVASAVENLPAHLIELPPGFTRGRRGAVRGYLIIPLHEDTGGEEDSRRAKSAEGETCPARVRRPVGALYFPVVVSSWRLRVLVLGFVLVASLPTLAVGAVHWLSERDAAVPSVDIASSTTAEVAITLPEVSAPGTLRATAGEDTTFPVSVKEIDHFANGAVVAISQLPRGAMLSAGMPDGKGSWRLRRSDIDGLRLVLPRSMTGEAELKTQLLAPDGHVISQAVTDLSVVALPEPAIVIRRVKTEVIPADVWEHPIQDPSAVDAKSEPGSVTSPANSMSPPTRHP